MGAPVKRKVLVDSDVVIRYLNGVVEVREEFRLIGAERLTFSVVTEAECISTPVKNQRQRACELFREVEIVGLSDAISRRFRGLVLSHAPRSKWIPDALIAATALEYGRELYTYNRKDFDFIEGLQHYSPKYAPASHRPSRS